MHVAPGSVRSASDAVAHLEWRPGQQPRPVASRASPRSPAHQRGCCVPGGASLACPRISSACRWRSWRRWYTRALSGERCAPSPSPSARRTVTDGIPDRGARADPGSDQLRDHQQHRRLLHVHRGWASVSAHLGPEHGPDRRVARWPRCARGSSPRCSRASRRTSTRHRARARSSRGRLPSSANADFSERRRRCAARHASGVALDKRLRGVLVTRACVFRRSCPAGSYRASTSSREVFAHGQRPWFKRQG